MNNSESVYIKHCKNLIEKKLGWKDSADWKQRDYLSLIEQLESKTRISLSLSTIKRIWKANYDGTPHPSTLEAFALFLDYTSWLDFKEKNKLNLPLAANSLSITDRLRYYAYHHKVIALLLLVLFLSGAVFVTFQFWSVNDISGKLVFKPEEVSFSCNNSVSRGVPNTVIFKYDLSRVQADSFFIQQSWNKFRRDKVLKNGNNLTSVYYYPGYHNAKLIANDSVIKDVNVRVNTDKWLALARYNFMDDVPVYIRNKDILSNGELHVKSEHLAMNHIDINKNPIVSYYYVDDFKNISSSNFSFAIRLKCDSILNIACPQMTVCIMGEKHINFIPLTTPGCIGNTGIKIGNVVKDGKNNDLSAFGVNVYNWQDLKITVINKKATVYLNNHSVYEVSFAENIGDIVGFNVNFTGTGSIDYVWLFDKNNKLVYNSAFN